MRLPISAWMLAGLLGAFPAPAATTPPRAAPEPAWSVEDTTGERIALWPRGQVPGEHGPLRMPRVIERSGDPAHPDRYVDQIDAPWLAVYTPRRPNGQALLVIPGGGYQRVVVDKEGSELAPDWVERAGYTLFVLRYRLPQPGRDRQAALADAQRAMRVIRSLAPARGLDAAGVSVMGFSAGGHIAARLATGFDRPAYRAADAADRLDARPARAILVYPVIDMGDLAHQGSRRLLLGDQPSQPLLEQYSMQRQVRADMPPTLLLHADDDDVVRAGNSLLMADALATHGVEHELHVFAHGGHGFGMRAPPGSTTALWPLLAQRWLRAGQESRP